MKIAFLIIATNKYTQYLEPLHQSIKKHVKIDGAQIDTIAFTNKALSDRVIPTTKFFHVDHLPWPLITLLRYNTFVQYTEELQEYDYLHYLDADMIVASEIGTEIINDLTVTLHPGFYDKPVTQCPFETTRGSMAVPTQMPKQYFIGANFGGRTQNFLQMCNILKSKTEIDLYNNFIPIWHDESFLNSYMASQNPAILHPGYCYPENWNLPFEKKIIARDKNQKEIRF
jgi:hypothetical protein